MRDKKAPDGELAECERIVRAGGRVKYAGIWWQHDALKALEGVTIMVCSDYWRTELDIFDLPRSTGIQHLTAKPELTQ